MAYIAWRISSAGQHKAYLIHSYRDSAGKPRQRVLAMLGGKGELTAEHLAKLRQEFPRWKIKWEDIKARPKPVIDLASLSDAELLTKLRILRQERGLTLDEMWRLLWAVGVCEFSGPLGGDVRAKKIGQMENALKKSLNQGYFVDPLNELAPSMRKIFAEHSLL